MADASGEEAYPNLTGEWHEVWGSVGGSEGVVGGLSLWEENGKVHGAHITAEGAGPPGTCSILGTTALNSVTWTFIEWGTVFDGRVDPARRVIQGLCVRKADGDSWRVKFQRTSVGGGLTTLSRSMSPTPAVVGSGRHVSPAPLLREPSASYNSHAYYSVGAGSALMTPKATPPAAAGGIDTSGGVGGANEFPGGEYAATTSPPPPAGGFYENDAGTSLAAAAAYVDPSTMLVGGYDGYDHEPPPVVAAAVGGDATVPCGRDLSPPYPGDTDSPTRMVRMPTPPGQGHADGGTFLFLPPALKSPERAVSRSRSPMRGGGRGSPQSASPYRMLLEETGVPGVYAAGDPLLTRVPDEPGVEAAAEGVEAAPAWAAPTTASPTSTAGDDPHAAAGAAQRARPARTAAAPTATASAAFNGTGAGAKRTPTSRNTTPRGRGKTGVATPRGAARNSTAAATAATAVAAATGANGAPAVVGGSLRLVGVQSRYMSHFSGGGGGGASAAPAAAAAAATPQQRHATPTHRGAPAAKAATGTPAARGRAATATASPRAPHAISDRLAKLSQPSVHRRGDSAGPREGGRKAVPSPARRPAAAATPAPAPPPTRARSTGAGGAKGTAGPAVIMRGAKSGLPIFLPGAAVASGGGATPVGSGGRATPTRGRDAAGAGGQEVEMTEAMQRLSSAVQSRGFVPPTLAATEALQLEAYRGVMRNTRMRQKRAQVDSSAKQLKLLSVLTANACGDAAQADEAATALSQAQAIERATETLTSKQTPLVNDIAGAYDVLVKLLSTVTDAPMVTPGVELSMEELAGAVVEGKQLLEALPVDALAPPEVAGVAAKVEALQALCADAYAEVQFLADFLQSGILLRYLSLKADLHRRRAMFASFAAPPGLP